MNWMPHHAARLAFCLVLCLLPVLQRAEARERFTARLADGKILAADELTDWHSIETMPRLAGQALFTEQNPALWLRDRSLRPGEVPVAYVEMIGGDRLPGEVLSFTRAGLGTAEPACLVVESAVDLDKPGTSHRGTLQVLESFVRRIVWQARDAMPAAYQPGTLFYRDGRLQRYRAIRFSEQHVSLLTETGQVTSLFSEIAELHLPERDPWQSYYAELAILCPNRQGRLMQVETTDGLIVTASIERMDATVYGNSRDSDRWWHGLQPAWALRPLWAPGGTVWMRRMWAPHEVPLSRLLPAPASDVAARQTKHHAWSALVNRNVLGGALESGHLPHGWGYGVHAASRLSFTLPKLATSFRTRFGLDDSVGAGGCVRVRVWTGESSKEPRYESSLLVGSQQLGDTGPLDLTKLTGDQRTLTLEVDAAHAERPAGADPLNIRDRLNWLDPLITLDPETLWERVAEVRWHWCQPWEDWTLHVPGEGSVEVVNIHDHHGPGPDRYELGVRAVDRPLTLSRTVKVTPAERWLIVTGWVYHAYSDRAQLELRVDGLPVQEEFIVPMRPGGHRQPPAMIVSLAPYVGHEVRLELAQTPGDHRLPVVWRSIQITDQIPWLHRIVEDNELPRQLAGDQTGEATLVADDKHTGERSLKLTPAGRFHLEFAQPLKISLTPELGEFRYLRFAFRKFGKGRISIELDHADAEANPLRHDAGFGPPCFGKAHRVWTQPLPSEWIVMTRDLCADFPIRSAEVTGLTLSVPDGDYALFDHIYLARNDTDFQQLPLAASPEATNQKAFDALAASLWEQTSPAIARLEIDGRQATGVLVGRGGELLTAGHVIGGVDRKVSVRLADGRQLEARSQGIDRTNDLALLRLPAGEYPGLEINSSRELDGSDRYGAVSFTRDQDTPLVTKATSIKVAFRETIWIEQSIGDTLTGGPLLDVGGRVVGLHSRMSRLGGQLYAAGWRVSLQMERLRQGKMFDSWVAGSGPTLGIQITPVREGAKVDALALPAGANSPLQAGDIIVRVDTHSVVSQADIDQIVEDKDPGDMVKLELLRDGERRTETATLLYRLP